MNESDVQPAFNILIFLHNYWKLINWPVNEKLLVQFYQINIFNFPSIIENWNWRDGQCNGRCKSFHKNSFYERQLKLQKLQTLQKNNKLEP